MSRQADEFVISSVADHPVLARELLDLLIKDGIEISVDPSKLTHDEIRRVIWRIYEELRAQENLQ